MKLYYTPGACSLAPHIIAREADLYLQVVRVDLATKAAEDGSNLLEVTGKGSVPQLVLSDGRVLAEGVAIMQFLGDLAPQSGLVPPWGTFERYKLQEWLNFLSTELHKGFAPLWSKASTPEAHDAAKQALALKIDLLERHLQSREWLMEGFGAADAYAFTVLNWSALFGLSLDRWPAVSDFMNRVAARPAVRSAMQAEGILIAA
jgi:glutathione S-transferase